MRKTILGIVLMSSLGGAAAYAGLKTTSDIIISVNSDGSGTVDGSLAGVHNSPHPYSYILCQYSAYAWQPPTAYCIANDGQQFFSCFTMEPTLTDAIGRLDGDDRVYFGADANGECTFVWVSSTSWQVPKTH
jgi:hypothetical protein